MSFTLKKSRQTDELITQLQLGQIIKVHVLEKTNSSQYLISYKNLQLTAVSEVDLFAKSVWLKVTQKNPFPKLQIIIEENDSCLKELFEYANDQNLIIPQIPCKLKEFLTISTVHIDKKDLYDFVGWYTEKIAWSVLSERHFVHLLACGITCNELTGVFKEIVLPSKEHCTINAKLLISINDIDSVDSEVKEKILPTIKSIEKINSVFRVASSVRPQTETESGGIALLYIKHPLFRVIMPLEYISGDTGRVMTGILKTKHFGNIFIKCDTASHKPEIKLLFENNLYINSLKNDFYNCARDHDIILNLGLQPIPNPQNYAQRDWKITI